VIRTAVTQTHVALFKSLLIVCSVFSAQAFAQTGPIEIITCEDFSNPKTADDSYKALNPTSSFPPLIGEENVSVVLRFPPFNRDITLRIIVAHYSPDGAYVDSRKLKITATDKSAATRFTISESGNYYIKVVDDVNEHEAYGTAAFSINNSRTSFSRRLIDFKPFAPIVILLILLSVAEHFRVRSPAVLKRLYKRPILLATLITFIVLATAILLESREYNLLQHSNLIGILGIIGIIGTIIGVILTYGQLKLAEDRIENYEKFYDALDELLKDPKARSLQFSGSTILPGQVAYGDRTLLLRYMNSLETCTNRLLIDSGEVKIIVPSEEIYREAYRPYEDKTCRGHKYNRQEIDDRIGEALVVQHSIDQKSDMVEISRKEEIAVIDAFYFSNGRTAIYAVPLHYNLARVETFENDKQKEQGEPVLVGFKTTNRSIVEAFEQNFQKLMSEIGFSLRSVDLRNLSSLILKVRDAADPLSRYIRERLSPKLQQLLDQYDGTPAASESLRIALLEELNQLLKRPDLFNEQLLSQVGLTDEINGLIKRNPRRGERLIRLNRLILEAIFPDEIKKRS